MLLEEIVDVQDDNTNDGGCFAQFAFGRTAVRPVVTSGAAGSTGLAALAIRVAVAIA